MKHAGMYLADWFIQTFAPRTALRGDGEVLDEDMEQAEQYLRRLEQKPKLATVRNAPSRDEFAAWRQDPTTAFVMAALLRNAVECEDKWFIDSWEAGKADQRTLDGLRERADALRGIAEADYEAFCETLGLEPEPLHGDAA